MSFPQALAAELDRLTRTGWTRETLSAALGYTRQTLGTWTRGAATPSPALKAGIFSVLRSLPNTPPKN